MKKKFIIRRMRIYIDGSCRPSSRNGAFGVLVIDDQGHRKVITGTRQEVTNNMMELTALIEALKYLIETKLDKENKVEIFSDSTYVVNGVNLWWVKWKANGYKTTTGLVKNLELWKELEPLCAQVSCHLSWIKGHAGCAEHNEIDRIVFNLTA